MSHMGKRNRNEVRSNERGVRSDESGVIVFGGGGRGCSGRGCLFWIVVSVVLSVGLTILINLVLLLFSGGGSGVNV